MKEIYVLGILELGLNCYPCSQDPAAVALHIFFLNSSLIMKLIMVKMTNALLQVWLFKKYAKVHLSYPYVIRKNFFFHLIFLIEGYLLYRILWFSIIHKQESAIGIPLSPPS